jgi:hypothetical protein
MSTKHSRRRPLAKIVATTIFALAGLAVVGGALAASTPPQPGKGGTTVHLGSGLVAPQPGRWGTSLVILLADAPASHARVRVRR